MFSALSASRTRLGLLALVLFTLGGHIGAAAQTNDLGNGGIHSIQGRIYLANGRRSDVAGLRIRLINFASNDLSIIADSSGAFTFKQLIAGSYVVKIEGGGLFEDVQENVTIDDPGSSTLSETIRLRGGAKIANVQIFLKPKAVAGGVPPEVLYALLNFMNPLKRPYSKRTTPKRSRSCVRHSPSIKSFRLPGTTSECFWRRREMFPAPSRPFGPR
jgi:hypothetical protein